MDSLSDLRSLAQGTKEGVTRRFGFPKSCVYKSSNEIKSTNPMGKIRTHAHTLTNPPTQSQVSVIASKNGCVHVHVNEQNKSANCGKIIEANEMGNHLLPLP